MQPAPPPPTPLGKYRLLSPTAAVRVSPLCLGAMSLGDAWEFLGTQSKENSFKILDAFYDAGGNFIDTANNYQNEQSETWLGEWMVKRQNRSQMVIATKFTTGYRSDWKKEPIHVNFAGNSAKSLHESVAASLKKLQTDYIDLLYVHWWDYTCSIPELMQSLDHLVKAGKVLYLGASDTPAWVVAKANQYARDHGLRQFSVYQGLYSAAKRDAEREILPMVRDEGMAFAPWGALGGGKFKTKEQVAAMEKANDKGRAFGGPMKGPSKVDESVTAVLDKIGKSKNVSLTQIALAYAIAKQPYVFPIVGIRKLEHLQDNIDALKVRLSKEEIKEIEEAYDFEPGFPHDFIGYHPSQNWLLQVAGHYDWIEMQKSLEAS
jgi:aryl-alcohol dehydrogenase-like predicted oxidoreductase